MPGRELKHKPLVEAILELRWALTPQDPMPGVDPHFRLLLGRFYDRVLADFPEHESLPSVGLPDEFVGHSVQHRFRVKPKGWPLVQIGPGVVSLNSTDDYSWDAFQPKAVWLIEKLFESHPKRSDLRCEALILRYIDAIALDFLSESVLDFIRAKLKVDIQLPPMLFDKTGVDSRPVNFSWSSTFKVTAPKGVIDLRFATGHREKKPALIWESTFRSMGDDLPKMPEDFAGWVNGAHKAVNDWFFKLIEGDLRRQFQDE